MLVPECLLWRLRRSALRRCCSWRMPCPAWETRPVPTSPSRSKVWCRLWCEVPTAIVVPGSGRCRVVAYTPKRALYLRYMALTELCCNLPPSVSKPISTSPTWATTSLGMLWFVWGSPWAGSLDGPDTSTFHVVSGVLLTFRRATLRNTSSRDCSTGVSSLSVGLSPADAGGTALRIRRTAASQTWRLMNATSLRLMGDPRSRIRVSRSESSRPAHGATCSRVVMALSSASEGSMTEVGPPPKRTFSKLGPLSVGSPMHDWAEASPAHCSSCLCFVGVSPPDGWALEERQDVRARGPGTHLRPGLLGLALANGAGARRAQWWPSLILSRTEGTGCCTAAFPT